MIDIHILNESENENPKYATEGSSGLDLQSTENVMIGAGEVVLISTGIKVAVPEGYELQIRPRSGLALKKGITVLNTPGTIDSDYRGEVGVILINHSHATTIIDKGERIAQAVLSTVERVQWISTKKLPITDRGEDGFGSSGRQGTEL